MKKFFSSTRFLIYGVWLIGFIITFAGATILDSVYGESIPVFLRGLMLAPALICMLVNGIVMIKRQECPRVIDPSITGFWAVVSGWVIVFGTVFCFLYIVFTLVNP